MSQVTFGTALYYPNLTMDSDWLKASLLYWDRVRRIVPPDAENELNDQEGVRIAAAEGLVVNTSPAEYVVEAETRFKAKVLPLLETTTRSLTSTAKRIREDLLGGLDRHRMYAGKLTHALANELRKLHGVGTDGSWMVLPEEIYTPYMVCLGAAMSNAMNAPLITDTPEFAARGEYALFGHPPRDGRMDAPRSVLLKLGLDFPAPFSLRDHSMKQIIRFHEKTGPARRRFRESLETVSANAATIHDPRAFDDFLWSKHQEIVESLKEYRARLSDNRFKLANSILDLKSPSGLATIGGAAASIVHPFLGTALLSVGLAVGVRSWWAEVRAAKRELPEKFPWHYSVLLQDDLGKKRTVRRG